MLKCYLVRLIPKEQELLVEGKCDQCMLIMYSYTSILIMIERQRITVTRARVSFFYPHV